MSDSRLKMVQRDSVIYTALEQDESQKSSPQSQTDFESMTEKIPYPKGVYFIVITEFCERFCYYGIRAVLPLYLETLEWDEDLSTAIFHLWISACYFMPLLGAMLADSLLGKFRTIFYLSIVYICGGVVLSVAASPPLRIINVELSMVCLALISIGTGGIKPCVSAFGGDQFQIPGQDSQLESYFAIFYFSVNCGAVTTQIVTPIFREYVSCFGDDTCYPLAFGVPIAVMIAGLVIFLSGSSTYKIVKPKVNILLKLLQAVKHSFSRRGSEIKAGRQREHWLDYANDKFDQRFLDEVKVVFKVLFLYIPLPIFWTLIDQQGSRWIFQATRMNGKISDGFGIKPDQMQVFNPAFILISIPLFERVIYPLLGKCNLLNKPLQRLAVGLLLAGLSFAVSGIIELLLVANYADELARKESSLHIFNALPVYCDLKVEGTNGNGLGPKQLLPNEMVIYESISKPDYEVQFTINQGCEGLSLGNNIFQMESGKATTYVLTVNNTTPMVVNFVKSAVDRDLEKSDENTDSKFRYHMSGNHSGIPGGLAFGNKLDMKLGGRYMTTIVRTQKAGVDHSLHMLWQLPQFILISMGQSIFSITIMDFSYTEAPPSMKSVMQSAWLMTVAFGNLIAAIVAKARIFSEQYNEFFLFAGIMFVDCVIFSIMAYRYVPTVKFWEDDDAKEGENGDEKEQLGTALDSSDE